jgi:hypothetical protein
LVSAVLAASLALGVAAWPGPARAQAPAPAPAVVADGGTVVTPAPAAGAVLPAAAVPMRINRFFAAPGWYGVSYGSASYGLPRTYSEFASPYGPGYAYGYPPFGYGLLPGRFGVGLWRPGFVESGYVYGGAYNYRTFPVPYVPGQPAVTPPVGVYAPAFGPAYYGW